jgi:hypothetical protein
LYGAETGAVIKKGTPCCSQTGIIDMPESVVLGPVMMATFLSRINFVAAVTGLLWSSSKKYWICLPEIPPLLLASSNIAVKACFCGDPMKPAHPVKLSTTPTFRGSAPRAAVPTANIRKDKTVHMKGITRPNMNVLRFIAAPPFHSFFPLFPNLSWQVLIVKKISCDVFLH